MNILVLHGPNLNLLGERPGDDKGRTLAQLNAQIEKHAAASGVSVRILQSNHEGALIDALHQARAWAEAVVINPAALTHTSYVLREAIAAVGKPTIEVHLTDIRRRESWRRKSVIKDVCEAQIIGKGFDSYLLAIDRLLGKTAPKAKKKTATGSKAAAKPAPKKTLGRRVQQTAIAAGAPGKAAGSAVKTLGAAMKSATGAKPERGDVVSREAVRQKIAERLSGKLSPAGLSTWARSKWLDVQRGAPAESGHRELLEDLLQQLVLSSMPPAKLNEDQLIELMTQLDA